MEHKKIAVLLLVMITLSSIFIASARPAYLEAFNEQYGTDGTKLDSCNTCHINVNGGGARNPYGLAYAENDRDFEAIEALDSDGDGFTNLEEIRSLTFPGNPEDSPGTSDIDPSEVTVVNETQEPPNVTREQTDTEEQTESPVSDEQAPGFGAILAGLGVLSAIYWYRK